MKKRRHFSNPLFQKTYRRTCTAIVQVFCAIAKGDKPLQNSICSSFTYVARTLFAHTLARPQPARLTRRPAKPDTNRLKSGGTDDRGNFTHLTECCLFCLWG